MLCVAMQGRFDLFLGLQEPSRGHPARAEHSCFVLSMSLSTSPAACHGTPAGCTPAVPPRLERTGDPL